jgi:CubicO group peptidase (beta-lactamase class C family)
MNTRVIENEPVQPAMNEDHVVLAGSAQERNLTGDVGRWIARPRRIALVVLLTALVSAGAFLASRPGGSDATRGRGATSTPALAAIDSYIRSEMDAQRIPGLALGIVQGGRITHVRGFGEADSSGRAVSAQTPFVIGSLSKSLTALAVMQLVEAGKVDLDAPVQRYIPWFRVADEKATAEITVRHLLNQTSGLSTKTGRSFQGSGDTSDSALERAVRKLSAVQLAEPVGATHQYSTINYSVLGLVVQNVSGQSYERYIQEHVFNALKMGHSFTSEADAEPQGLATGHHYWFGRPTAAHEPYNRGLIPAGYLISSAEDMSHYLIAQTTGATAAKQFCRRQGWPNCSDRPFPHLKPARRTAWAGSWDRSTGFPRSSIRERRSTTTRTSCSCPRAIRESWC